MATILFDKIVYGPVHSRRLGVSLGINLFPKDEMVSCVHSIVFIVNVGIMKIIGRVHHCRNGKK